MYPVAVSKKIIPHFPQYLFSVWEMSCWNLLPCLSDMAAIISGKNPYESSENEVYRYSNISSPEKFNLKFPLIRYLGSFCRVF